MSEEDYSIIKNAIKFHNKLLLDETGLSIIYCMLRPKTIISALALIVSLLTILGCGADNYARKAEEFYAIGEYFAEVGDLLHGIPDHIQRYFDFESYGRDIRLELNTCLTSYGLVIDNR